MAQSRPAQMELVKTAEFRLSPELDQFPVRDIEWFTRTPSKSVVFVRREWPLGTLTLVSLDEAFAVRSAVKLELPWISPSTDLTACCLSPTLFVVFHNGSGADSRDCEYSIIEIATGKSVLTGRLPGISIDRAVPIWRKGCILSGRNVEAAGDGVKRKCLLLRLDAEMKEVWRVDDPAGPDGDHWPSTELRLLGKEFVGALIWGTPNRVLRFSVENGARSEVTFSTDEIQRELIDTRGGLIAILTHNGYADDLCFFESEGKLVHRRQVSAPLDSRAQVNPDLVVVDSNGHVWLSDGQSIYEIDVSSEGHRRAGPDDELPSLRRAAAVTVNRFGQILCLDARSGNLVLFDRDGRLLRSEPTSTVDFPIVSERILDARIEPLGDGGFWVKSATGSNTRVKFGADLTVKERVSSSHRFFSSDSRSSAMCEWNLKDEIVVRVPRESEKTVELDAAWNERVLEARVMTDGSVAAITYPPAIRFSLVCHVDDPKRRARHKIHEEVGATFLSSGGRWLYAHGSTGAGLLLDTQSSESWMVDPLGETEPHVRVQCFIDSSQTAGEELVVVDKVTRVVRRYALPKVSSTPQSAPAVK